MYSISKLINHSPVLVGWFLVVLRQLITGLLQSELILRQSATRLLQSTDSLLQSTPKMSALDHLSCISLSLFPHKNKAAKVA